MVLGRLAEIFGWDLDANVEIGDIRLFSSDKTEIEYNEKRIELNLGEMDSEKREEVLEVVSEQFESEGRVLRGDEAEEVEALESGYGADEDEIVGFFDGLVTEDYLTIIERGLWLRVLIRERELSKDQIDEYKSDLVDRYGPDARYLANLATAGYFDPNGGVRDLLQTLRFQEGKGAYDFYSAFKPVVDERLICVFVEQDGTVEELVQEIRGRISRHQRVDPLNSWLDVQGIGDECRGTIEAAMEQLEEEYFSIDYDWRADIGEGATVRIHVETVPSVN